MVNWSDAFVLASVWMVAGGFAMIVLIVVAFAVLNVVLKRRERARRSNDVFESSEFQEIVPTNRITWTERN